MDSGVGFEVHLMLFKFTQPFLSLLYSWMAYVRCRPSMLLQRLVVDSLPLYPYAYIALASEVGVRSCTLVAQSSFYVGATLVDQYVQLSFV